VLGDKSYAQRDVPGWIDELLDAVLKALNTQGGGHFKYTGMCVCVCVSVCMCVVLVGRACVLCVVVLYSLAWIPSGVCCMGARSMSLGAMCTSRAGDGCVFLFVCWCVLCVVRDRAPLFVCSAVVRTCAHCSCAVFTCAGFVVAWRLCVCVCVCVCVCGDVLSMCDAQRSRPIYRVRRVAHTVECVFACVPVVLLPCLLCCCASVFFKMNICVVTDCVVTATVLQKTGAGMHQSNACLWDESTDGTFAVYVVRVYCDIL